MSLASRMSTVALLALTFCASAAAAAESPTTTTTTADSAAQGVMLNDGVGVTDTYVANNAAPMAVEKPVAPHAAAPKPRRLAAEHHRAPARYPVIVGIQY